MYLTITKNKVADIMKFVMLKINSKISIVINTPKCYNSIVETRGGKLLPWTRI